MRSTSWRTTVEYDDVLGYDVTVNVTVQFEPADRSVGYMNPYSYVDDWEIVDVLDENGNACPLTTEITAAVAERIGKEESIICDSAAEDLGDYEDYIRELRAEARRDH